MIVPSLGTAAEYIAAIRNGNAQHFRVTFSDGTVIGDNRIVSDGVRYSEQLNTDEDITFGKAVSASIEFSVENSDGAFGTFDFTQEFEAEIGVEEGNSTSWASLGTFIGEKPERLMGSEILVTGYDRMSLFEQKSAGEFLDAVEWPCSLLSFYTQLCEYCGAEASTDTSKMLNKTKVFETRPLESENMTCRELLAYIAEACGGYARMGRDNTVEITWYAHVDYILRETDQFETVVAEYTTKRVDMLDVQVTESDIGVAVPPDIYGENVYHIIGNPLLAGQSDGEVRPYAEAIYGRLNSLTTYSPMTTVVDGDALVQCGDIIMVEDDSGNVKQMPVMSISLTWTGISEITYSSTGSESRTGMTPAQREKLVYGHTRFELNKTSEGLNLIVERAHIGEDGVEELHNSSLDVTAEGIEMRSGAISILSGGSLQLEAESDNAATVNGGVIWHSKNMIVSTEEPADVKTGDIWIKPNVADALAATWSGKLNSRTWTEITNIKVTGEPLGEGVATQNNKYTVKVPIYHTSSNKNSYTAAFYLVPTERTSTDDGVELGSKSFTEGGWFEKEIETPMWLGNLSEFFIRVIIYRGYGNITPDSNQLATVACLNPGTGPMVGWKSCEVFWYAGSGEQPVPPEPSDGFVFGTGILGTSKLGNASNG